MGFVIKRFLPLKQKVMILSRQSGKINGAAKNYFQIDKLWPGQLISYSPVSLSTSGIVHLIDQVEILHLPFDGTSNHFVWFHHLLEICYYFLPLESPCVDIFDHILVSLDALTDEGLREYSALIKRTVLVKLFALLGFYPEKRLISMAALFNHIQRWSVDSEKHAALHSFKTECNAVPSTLLSLADAWVLTCIKTHPNVSSFKTLKFLKSTEQR